ncbi:zinc ribbon domain-containing protein [Peptoanaerobacter stomatis]
MYINENKMGSMLTSLKIKFYVWAVLVFVGLFGIFSGLTGDEKLADGLSTYIETVVVFSILAYLNFRKSNLIKSLYEYNSIFVNSPYDHIDLSELSSKLNKPIGNVIKDIQKLVKMKLLINISLDLGHTQKLTLLNYNRSEIRSEYESIECPSCGAKMTKKVGFVAKCEYCGSEIK